MAPSPPFRLLRALVPLAVVPVVAALVAGGPRLGGLLSVMWLALIGTVAFAALSPGRDEPNTYGPRGRVHG